MQNVSKNYQTKEVLKKINIEIKQGSVVALLGKNGSGKTTTFRLLTNLINDYQGAITLNDNPIRLKDISYLPEQRSLYQDCTLYQHLIFISQLNGFKKQESKEKIVSLLKQTNLEKQQDEVISSLSKGNQQKVALVISLLKDATVLILDEPFTGLDEENIEIFKDLILKEKEKGHIVILSSHILQPVEKICDHFLYLDEGHIKLDVTTAAIKEDGRYVIELLKDNPLLDKIYDYEIEEENSIKIIANVADIKKIINKCLLNNYVFKVQPISIQELIALC